MPLSRSYSDCTGYLLASADNRDGEKAREGNVSTRSETWKPL